MSSQNGQGRRDDQDDSGSILHGLHKAPRHSVVKDIVKADPAPAPEVQEDEAAATAPDAKPSPALAETAAEVPVRVGALEPGGGGR